jgi:hypothetical protein
VGISATQRRRGRDRPHHGRPYSTEHLSAGTFARVKSLEKAHRSSGDKGDTKKIPELPVSPFLFRAHFRGISLLPLGRDRAARSRLRRIHRRLQAVARTFDQGVRRRSGKALAGHGRPAAEQKAAEPHGRGSRRNGTTPGACHTRSPLRRMFDRARRRSCRSTPTAAE